MTSARAPGFDRLEFPVATRNGRNCRLLDDVDFVRRSGQVVTIKAGATSDGASDPRPLWAIVPPQGWYWRAAFLHDYLYRCTSLAKEECDAIFLEAMELIAQNEAERLEAQALYRAVRIFGRAAFDQDRKAQAALQ